MTDGREQAPSVERNKEPIFLVLERVLPKSGLVLEIASGTGQHAAWFASRLPEIVWQTSELDRQRHVSIAAWTAGMVNVKPPLALDVADDDWIAAIGPEKPSAIFNANMIHIAPWGVCEGLLKGAGKLLPEGARLVFYGPFRRNGCHSSQSNAEFDFSLRTRNPAWGVRDLETVTACADINGFELDETVDMPANNLIVVFRRRPDHG